VQQIGVGEFSQSAFVQNHQSLVDAVNKALASPEFAKLEPTQKEGFKDVADTLLDEAKRAKPDPGKSKSPSLTNGIRMKKGNVETGNWASRF
jgi:hypothetical protein